MKSKKTSWIIIFTIVLLVLGTSDVFGQACCGFPPSDTKLVNPVSDSSAPDFTVPTINGGTFTLSANRGKPVVMFVMAYWCPTCFREAEGLAKLHKKYKDRVTIIALDVDPSSTPQSLALFKSQVGNPDYIWAFDKGGNVARSYKIKALETTIIFDQSGKVVFKDLRSTSYRTLEKQITLILG